MTDYTIASKVVPPTFDPLKTIGTAQAVQAGMLQNRLLGQNVQQTLAQRAAAQASIDPATGQSDPDLYSAALAKGGASPEALLQAQQQRQLQLQTKISQLGLTKAQMELSSQELQNGAQVAQGVLANGTKDPTALSKASISSAIENNLIQPGLIKSPEGIAHAKALEGMMTDDPQQNAQLLQQFVNQSTDITKAMGAVNQTDNGTNIVQQRINPATGAPTTTGVIQKGLSPSEVNTPAYTTTDVNGQQHIVTKGAAAAAAPGTTPAAITSGVPLGGEQAAAANVAQAQALQQRASIVPQRKAALSNLQNTLQNFQPGPKADLTYALGSLATQFGVAPPSTAKGVAAQEEFNKLGAQIALDQWGSLGGTGTDQQLSSTMKANPHQAMSQMGIKNVTALLQGNEDAIQAQSDAWQKFKAVHGPASYDQFQNSWNKIYDPRVFQAQHMAPADVKSMIASMTPAQKTNYQRAQSIAQQAGWLGQ